MEERSISQLAQYHQFKQDSVNFGKGDGEYLITPRKVQKEHHLKIQSGKVNSNRTESVLLFNNATSLKDAITRELSQQTSVKLVPAPSEEYCNASSKLK